MARRTWVRILGATAGGVAAAAAAGSGPAAGPEMLGGGFQPWTAVANTGAVDDDDLAEVDIAAQVTIDPAVAVPATVVLRYNVTAVDGLINPLEGWVLRARLRDNGSGARVLVQLREYDFATGIAVTRMTLDSNAFPAAAGYVSRDVSACSPPWSLDFFAKAYWIEATLTRGTTAGNPGLAAISLGSVICD